jgi:SAM-dependent methyltransferase
VVSRLSTIAIIANTSTYVSPRLDEQHIFTTKTLGFLIHPNIQLDTSSPTLKVADIGTGTGIWLLDVAATLPLTCQLTGYDVSPSGFPPPETLPANVSFRTHDMHRPFPASELGTYGLVAVRFVSSATTRADWSRAVANLAALLKPGIGWLQWIDSCNFALYNAVPGTARAACREIYEGAVQAAFAHHGDDEAVIGLMMREKQGSVRREEVFREAGLVDVHEDVFSTDRLQEPELQVREKGTRNVIACFVGCLEALVGVDGSGWTRERIERVKEEAMREIDQGVYHTLDQVCIVGRRAAEGV